MQSASRFFRHTPLVQGLPQATLICALGCALAWVTPVDAQTGWRTVSSSPAAPAVVVTPIPKALAPAAPVQTEAPVDGGLQMFGVTLSTATRAEMR